MDEEPKVTIWTQTAVLCMPSVCDIDSINAPQSPECILMAK